MAALKFKNNRIKINKFKLLLFVILILLVFNSNDFFKLFYPMPYREQIVSSAEEFGIDPNYLAAIIKTESSFNAGAVSPKDARGLMQIMPETGVWIAHQMKLELYREEQLFDPAVNIRMGAWYITDLEHEFAGNKIIALAAYNGGRGNVNQWLKEQKISADLTDIESIPFSETRNFVTKVLKNYKIYTWLYK